MFKSKNEGKMKKTVEVMTNTFSSINAATKITGEIYSESDLRIDGQVTGNISCKTKIIIGSTASIIGNITSQNAEVSCQIKGNIYVEELLKLNSSAIVTGDLYTKKLIIENGAFFTGRCEMGNTSKPDFSKPEISKKEGELAQPSLFGKSSE